MPIKKLSKPNGKVAAKRKPAAKSSTNAASLVKGARRTKTGPMAAVLNQSKGVQSKVKRAGVKLGGVNKVLKNATKKSKPATAVVHAVEKSADVEAKVQEAAAELVVVNEALSVESEVRRKIEGELRRSEVALASSRELERRARHEALHDQVTGLPNAALFRDRLKSALAQARRHSWRIAVMFIDLDGFKQINDTYGHDIGDALLRLVAERLTGFVRGGDTVSRRSGDEFLFLMLEAKSANNARAMARRIVAEIGRPVVIKEVKLSVSASIGLAMCPGDGTTVATLLNKADVAMYEAKGRQRSTR